MKRAEAAMSYGVIHLYGHSDDAPGIDNLGELYDELEKADQTHFEVTVLHDESGYIITAHAAGYVVLDNMENIDKIVEYRHIDSVTREQVIDMWRKLVTGDIESILALPWRPGLPEPLR
jgi:hypothetical protein